VECDPEWLRRPLGDRLELGRQQPWLRSHASEEWFTVDKRCHTRWGICRVEVVMATKELTGENFGEIVGGADMVLIDFWAAWCGPCRFFAPVYERVSQRHADIVFGKVDTEAQPELAAAFQISSIPTLMIIREQVALFAQPGALPEQVLEELIAETRAVDMDEVHRRLAQERASA
jgi:thioredoxin 1